MRAVSWSVLLVFAAGCGGEDAGPVQAVGSSGSSGSSGTVSTVCRAQPLVQLAAPVADARGRKPFGIVVDLRDSGGMRGPHPLKVVFSKGETIIKVLGDSAHEPGPVTLALDPAVTRDLETGGYTITATAGCPAGASESKPGEAKAPLYLARLGMTQLDVRAGDGARVDLLYHAVDKQVGNVFPIGSAVASRMAIGAGEADLDDANGALRTFPKPWADLDSPPVDDNGVVVEDGVTFPVSLRVGTKPDLVFSPAKTAQGSNTGQRLRPTGLGDAAAPPVRVVVEGTPAAESSIVKAGEPVTVRMAASPVPSVARVEQAFRWHFEAKAADGKWSEVPGSDQEVTVRLYGVLGNTQGTAAPELPWVAVVDDATAAVKGTANDAAGTRAALVRHIYEEMGLSYDRAQGASHYTAYAGSYSNASFRLARFLKRSSGSIVNCSDCASILSTYSNMVGAELKYTIILSGFNLNPILGIGATTFGSPFNSGRLSFSYHAVTSDDAAATIYDATLAVDGDTTPAEAPYMKKLVQGMSGTEYLQRLSGDPRAKYTYVDQTTSVAF